MIRNNFSVAFLIVVPTLFLIGLFFVLKISFSTPVEMANDYLMTYKEVDKNFDKIYESEKKFDSQFKADVTSGDKFNLNSNVFSIKISTVSGALVSDANVSAILTRPETTKYDRKLSDFKYQNSQFVSSAFDLPKEGRWQLKAKVQINDTTKFLNFEGFARKSN